MNDAARHKYDIHGEFLPIDEADAEAIIAEVESVIRSQGKSHRELAAPEVEPAIFTLFMQRKFPADWASVVCRTRNLDRLNDRHTAANHRCR